MSEWEGEFARSKRESRRICERLLMLSFADGGGATTFVGGRRER